MSWLITEVARPSSSPARMEAHPPEEPTHLEVVDDGNDEPPMDDEDDGEEVGEEEEGGDVEMDEDMACETFAGHTGPVYSVAVHPLDPYMMLSGGGDDRAYLWTAASVPRPDGDTTQTEVWVKDLGGHEDSVTAVAFSRDGSLAAAASCNGHLDIWDTRDKGLVRTLEGPEDIEWIDWHSKGNIILAGSRDKTVWMWLASTGDCMQVFAGHEGEVTCGLFTTDGKNVCTGSSDGMVRVWGPKTGACKHVFSGHGFHEGPVTTMASHHEGALLLTGSEDGTARLLHVVNKRILATLVHCPPGEGGGAAGGGGGGEMEVDGEEGGSSTMSVESVGFSRVFNWCATGGMDGTLKIWDLSNYSCRHVCAHEGGGVVKLRWHDSQPLVFTACTDGALRLWDARNGEVLYTLTGHTDMILDFDVVCRPPSQGGDVIVTASDDGQAKVFSIRLEN